MKFHSLFLTVLACFLLISCSSDVTKGIVGEWQGQIVQQTLTFYEDGYIDMASSRHSTYEGTYIITDGNKLTMVFPKLSRPISCSAKISGDELSLDHPSGRVEVYKRL